MKRGRLKTGFWFQTTFFHSSNLVPSPVRRGKVRMGGGWLYGLRENQIRAARRATLSPTLSRRTGEGVGCKSRYKFLPSYRRSRVGGNLLLTLGNCFLNICFLEFPMDSRLRGNDGGGMVSVV